MTTVMLRAKRTRLEPDDLLLLNPWDHASEVSTALKVEWEREVTRAAAEKAAAKPEDKKKPRPASLAKAIWPLIRGTWCKAFACHVTSVGLAFVGPLVLTYAIVLIQKVQFCGLRESAIALDLASNSTGDNFAEIAPSLRDSSATISQQCRDEHDLSRGYYYALAMLCSKLVEATFQSWHSHLMTRCALRARSGIISAIYRKSLWLSSLGGSQTTVGNMQNLMANDAQFFLQFAPLANNLFVAPVQIIVAFTWLSTLIGPSFLAGLGVMILAIPIQVRLRWRGAAKSHCAQPSRCRP